MTCRRDLRAIDISKWPDWRLWKLAIESIIGFCTTPLKLAFYLTRHGGEM
ncbi:hypothetical protein [Nitrosomonas sp. HPC101]|nr:hypothetical protein [Nitrosomonas sp. HPC101]